MARHRVDVDQLWSDRDLVECRGLQRGNNGLEREGTLPSFHCGALSSVPDVRVNFVAGVALYYMLSGEPKALECCLRNAEGIKGYWAWAAAQKNLYPRYDPRGDLGPVAWNIAAYCALYDVTGQRKWLSEALGLFSTHVGPLWKRFGPHLHDPADQIRGPDYQYDDAKYCYAIAALCELHRLTGDEEVLKLLKEGCEKPFPESYYDAPIFLADLYAYVGLKTANEAYMKKAAGLFAQGFPESKCPPVYLPDNSVWSRTSAMALRAGHLLQYAHWKQNEKKR
jgi:hypothetical protein